MLYEGSVSKTGMGRGPNTTGEKMESYSSVRSWKKSLKQQSKARKKPFSRKTWRRRLVLLEEYCGYAAKSPDDLLIQDLESTMEELNNYFDWLKTEREPELSHNSAITKLAYVRGFFTHNMIAFPKGFKLPTAEPSEVTSRDSDVEVYSFNIDTEEMYLNDLLGNFVAHLSFRDETVARCLLSTGTDTIDLLSLNVSSVDKQWKADRFLYRGRRNKTNVPFMVYLSKQSTEFIKQYCEKYHKDADLRDPLFLGKGGGALTTGAVQQAFRDAARSMGLTKTNEANPFRPKRFRHLFRNACAIARIDRGFTNSWMGHKTDVSDSYLGESPAIHLSQYVKVEPLLEVSSASGYEAKIISGEIQSLKEQIARLENDNFRMKDFLSGEGLMNRYRDRYNIELHGGYGLRLGVTFWDLDPEEQLPVIIDALRDAFSG